MTLMKNRESSSCIINVSDKIEGEKKKNERRKAVIEHWLNKWRRKNLKEKEKEQRNNNEEYENRRKISGSENLIMINIIWKRK